MNVTTRLFHIYVWTFGVIHTERLLLRLRFHLVSVAIDGAFHSQRWRAIIANANEQCEQALIQKPLRSCIIFIWQMCRYQLFHICLLQSLFVRSNHKMSSSTNKGMVIKYFSIILSQLTAPGTRTSRYRQRISSKYGTVCNCSYIHTTQDKNVLFIIQTFLVSRTWLFWYLSRIMLILIKVLFFPIAVL